MSRKLARRAPCEILPGDDTSAFTFRYNHLSLRITTVFSAAKDGLMALEQATRMLSLQTPLGANQLVLTGFRGQEEISRLFRFQLDMISDNRAIAAPDIVGKNVTFQVKLADNTPRFFNGFVSRFAAGDEDEKGRRNYRAEVVPWMWFLTRTSDCRIFQKKSVPDIIEQIFGDLGFSDYKLQLSGSHPSREYTVQYRETDFNFVSRLAEEEGIFWFFQHANGNHTLILADHKGAYVDCVESRVDYPHDFGSRAIQDHITSWEHRYEFRTGKIAQTDFNFQTPGTKLMTNSKTVVKISGADKYEFYDYPGIYGNTADGSGLTDIRMEEEEVEHDVVEATSLCKTFTPGGKFKIKRHRAGSEEGQTFVLTSIQHAAVEPLAYETGTPEGLDYRNSFSCIPESVTFRPPRITPKPFVQGVQTAIVVGPPGEEIHPDEFGRVKVQFHWDREGKFDENSSCWIRVSQVHAGKGWGAMDIPRIGEEVVVDFLEGDPDRPLITGRVYNSDNRPPFNLPAEKTRRGNCTKTYKGKGFNEMSMDDTPGKEQIRIHGQYDMNTTVEHDMSTTVKHDDTQHVINNRTITVDGTHTETIDKDTTIVIKTGNLSHDVKTGTALYHVKGAVQEKFEDSQETIVKNGIHIASETAHIYIHTATSIQLHVGKSNIWMDAGGQIAIKGMNIVIDGKESVTVNGGKVSSIAETTHEIQGGNVKSDAKGNNVVKGAMVMLNPGG